MLETLPDRVACSTAEDAAPLPSPSPAEGIASRLGAAAPRPVNANVDLVRQGDRENRVHLIVEGWACRYRVLRDGGRQIVALLVPGDVANLGALMPGASTCGVRTIGRARIVSFPGEAMTALMNNDVDVSRTAMRLMLQENAILAQAAVRLGRQSARQRLAHLLCELAERLGCRPRGGALRFVMPLTQEHLADVLGLTSVHVNRTVQQLRRDGLVRTVGRTVTLPDHARLAAEAEFAPAYLYAQP